MVGTKQIYQIQEIYISGAQDRYGIDVDKYIKHKRYVSSTGHTLVGR
jgi:hypothetical protein